MKKPYIVLIIVATWLIFLTAYAITPAQPKKIEIEETEIPKTEDISAADLPEDASATDIETAETDSEEVTAAVVKEYVYDEIPLDADIQEYMHKLCDDLSISYAFALAMMESESSFNAEASGDSGNSIGYMQINKCNWARMEEEYGLDVHDPKDNIAAGLYIMRELFEEDEDPYRAILCYKAGKSKGTELYESGIFKGKSFDCEALCKRAQEIEKAHE